VRLSAYIFASSLLATGLVSSALAESANDGADQELVGKYLDAARVQQETLRNTRMEVSIDARLPQLEKQGRLRAFRFVSRLGKITYKALGFVGDNTVKKEVIVRYLSLDTDNGSSSTDVSVTPANYHFRFKAKLNQGDRAIQVLELTPKKKHWWGGYKVGLFKGELWLDADTGMPVRLSGQWVTNPSVFVKRVEFVQEFEIQQNGVSIPSHIESTVDTRIAGRAELSINFSNFTPESGDPTENAEIGQADEDSPTP
jgi:hypothetical protein